MAMMLLTPITQGHRPPLPCGSCQPYILCSYIHFSCSVLMVSRWSHKVYWTITTRSLCHDRNL